MMISVSKLALPAALAALAATAVGAPSRLAAQDAGERAMRDSMAAHEQSMAAAMRDAERQVDAMNRRMALQRGVPGWLGINFTGGELRRTDKGDVVLWHEDYPRVVSVEPGSPADEAGLAAGDVIMAYDGRDVRRAEISLGRVLRPGRRVVVRVRRAGATREIPVVVAPRPVGLAQGLVVPDIRVEMAPAPLGDAPRRGEVSLGRPPRAPRAPMPPAPTLMPPMPDPGVIFFTPSAAVIAGAQLVAINADLGEVLDVRRGVFVSYVARGTPAATSGLRCGDVIVRAEHVPVASPAVLEQIVQRAAERGDSVSLQVVRKKSTRTVVLRW